MNGFLLIDKQSGMTSFDVVRQVRKLLKVRRVGHCGTLDPLATGLLIIAIGKATRLAKFVVGQKKNYEVEAKLGQSSDTYDREGQLSEAKSIDDIPRAAIDQALVAFRGKIKQRPPLYSAIKHEGKRLYKYARAGEQVEIPEREVTIHSLELTSVELPILKLTVECSKGTYIRSLVHDLGEKLGCSAHVTELRRTAIGSMTVEQAITLDALETRVEAGEAAECVIGITETLELPELIIEANKASRVPQGIEIQARDIVEAAATLGADQLVALRNGHGNLLAVGRTLLASADFAQAADAKAIEYVRVM